MTVERWMRVAVSLARQVAQSPDARWCSACVEVVGVTGAGVSLMGQGRAGPLCASSDVVAALEEAAFATGDGPCFDAHREQQPVHAARLDADAARRWPAFVDSAHDHRIRAVFAYPLCANGGSIGVLTIYNDTEGDLSESQHDDCVALAEVLAETFMTLQADAPDDSLAPSLDEAVSYRAELYQASGVVAHQLSVLPGEALDRIRAHSFSTGENLAAISAEILAHRLFLPNDRQHPEHEV